MDFKSEFEHMHSMLGQAETAARKLPNQHVADLIKATMGKLEMAIGHPDIEAVGVQLRTDLEAAHAEKEPGFLDGMK